MIPLWSAAARRRFCGRHRATKPYSCSTTTPRHSDRNDPTSAICHPERSGPTFPLAPPSGASGRVVEGSWHDFDLFAIHGTIPPNVPGAPGSVYYLGLGVPPVAQTLLSVLLAFTLTLLNFCTLTPLPSSLHPTVAFPLFRSLN